MKEFCENEHCENPGAKVVAVSVNKPADQERTLCAACEESFTWGVQHGTMTAGSLDLERMVPLRVDDRELATILAALRFHQDENLQGGRDIPDQAINEIATDGGLVKAMSFQEVSELCQKLNIKEAVRGHKRARVSRLHPAIQQIHDLLYLDMDGARQVYSDEKSWDADTLDMIAQIVAGYIPMPSPINSHKEGGSPHAKANGEST